MQDRRAQLLEAIERQLDQAALQLQLSKGRRHRQRALETIANLNRERAALTREQP